MTTREEVIAVLAGRGFTEVPEETVEALLPAVDGMRELGRQVARDLADLLASGTPGTEHPNHD